MLSIAGLNVVLDAVADITVTTIEADPATGMWVREFRFYGEAPSVGAPQPLLHTVRTLAAAKTDIDVSIPASSF